MTATFKKKITPSSIRGTSFKIGNLQLSGNNEAKFSGSVESKSPNLASFRMNVLSNMLQVSSLNFSCNYNAGGILHFRFSKQFDTHEEQERFVKRFKSFKKRN